MDADQVLAFRLARSGLARRSESLAAAAACPASDFARDAALLAVSARHEGVSRAEYDDAIDAGQLVLAHIVRGAIHVLTPGDFAAYGRGLLARDEVELGAQLGRQVQRLAAEKGFSPVDALGQVADATRDALSEGAALSKNELHDALRRRVNPDLMPWCKGCKSHHVAPMLWRYATVKAGARLDSRRRYLLAEPNGSPDEATALRRFLHFYGPAGVGDFADWGGLAKSHAQRLWDRVEGELSPMKVANRRAWLLGVDVGALESPPAAEGVRLLPPGDPYLQRPNRALLAPEPQLSKRLFRPVASPGAVLADGRLAGLWRVKAKRRRAEVTVERFAEANRAELEDEAQRIARLRGDSEAELVLD